jgi:long-subunit acyl-CoA synthetase (AMP-forming)
MSVVYEQEKEILKTGVQRVLSYLPMAHIFGRLVEHIMIWMAGEIFYF